MMELQPISLALPGDNNHIKKDCGSREPLWKVACMQNKNYIKGKRSFDEAFGKMKKTTQMSPLLVWSGQPNEEDDKNGQKKKNSCINYKIDEEENQVVGWPPIKSWRRKLLHQQHVVQHQREVLVEEENNGLVLNPVYVKVKMEDQRCRDGSCYTFKIKRVTGCWQEMFHGSIWLKACFDVLCIEYNVLMPLMIMIALAEHSWRCATTGDSESWQMKWINGFQRIKVPC